MKIIVDCSNLLVGGGIQAGLNVIYNVVNERGWEVYAFLSNKIYQQIDENTLSKLEGFHIFESSSFLNKLTASFTINRLIGDIKPDVVYCVFGPPYSHYKNIPFVQGFALGKMIYPESRRFYSNRYLSFKERAFDFIKKFKLLRRESYFIVETETVKKRFCSALGVSSDLVCVVKNSYNPIFEDNYISASRSVYEDSGTNKGIFRIFVPSGFYEHKNLEILPRVARALQDIYFNDFVFVFTINPGSVGWLRIQKLAQELNVKNNILTVGELSSKEIAKEYCKSSAVILTSLVESSTAVVPEAFLCRKPLLISDLDFARELCGDAAVYFNPFDSADIAKKIYDLFCDHNMYQTLVDLGIKQLKSTYPNPEEKWNSQKKFIEKVVSGYNKVKK